jgi:hypothetical protein
MRPIVAADIVSNASFKEQRPRLERQVIHDKEARRLAVGPNITLLFENRVTLIWQIQEMCRVEQIDRPEAVGHEIETYNGLLPRRDELSATMLLEYDEPVARAKMLAALRGLQNHMRLEIEGQEPVSGAFDAEQYNADRISSVQFVRFALLAGQVDALCDLRVPAAIVVDHPAYLARAPLTGAARGALVQDLLEGRG